MLHVTLISPSLTTFCMCNISESPNSIVLAFSSSFKTITPHKVIVHWCGLGTSQERCVTGSQTILVPYLLGLAAILGAFQFLPWYPCHFPCFICMAAASIEFHGVCLTHGVFQTLLSSPTETTVSLWLLQLPTKQLPQIHGSLHDANTSTWSLVKYLGGRFLSPITLYPITEAGYLGHNFF